MVNLVLSVYFMFVGVFTLTGTLAPFVQLAMTSKEKYGFKKTFPLIGEIDAEFTVAEFVSMVPATIFSAYYVKTKHFMMNNLLGISFCVQSIERISIGSYKTARSSSQDSSSTIFSGCSAANRWWAAM